MSPTAMPALPLRCSIALLVAAAACRGQAGTACTKDTDCPSHFCKHDGTCGVAATDAQPSVDGPPDSTAGACVPDHDGTIAAAELPLAAGRSATFRVATSATWSTAGQSNIDGSRTWDLGGQLANDADRTIALTSPAGAWWAADFPGATYAAPLSVSSDLLGVFVVGASSVTLLGVVSPAGGPS
jgi:hypothetical protein